MPGKKIACVFGSPRKNGNTRQTLDWMIEGTTEGNAEIMEIDAAHLNYNGYGCTACFGCQRNEAFRCVIQDEASDLIADLPNHDIILFACPVYWMSYPAQLKIFLDRMYSLIKIHEAGFDTPLKGKMFAMLSTGGGDIEMNLGLMADQLKTAAGLLEMDFRSLLLPKVPVDVKETAKDSNIREQCVRFGKELAES